MMQGGVAFDVATVRRYVRRYVWGSVAGSEGRTGGEGRMGGVDVSGAVSEGDGTMGTVRVPGECGLAGHHPGGGVWAAWIGESVMGDVG